MPTLAAPDLSTFARSLFEAGGVPADEAATIASGLVGANLCGHDSHGVIRVIQYLQFLGEGRDLGVLRRVGEAGGVARPRRPGGWPGCRCRWSR